MNELTPSLEDYLESIWMGKLKKEVVRVKDVAEHLGVKAASVVEAMNNLQEKELVVHEKYGYIELTSRGVEIAKEIYHKHKTLSKFFHEILGVEKKTACEDACKIEHDISEKTIDKIIKFIEFIDSYPKGKPIWLSKFHSFVRDGTRLERNKKQ